MNRLDRESKSTSLVHYDRWFVFAAAAIILLGLIMVASASMVVSEQQFHQPFHYFFRQIMYLALGFFVALLITQVEVVVWQRLSVFLLLVALLLLIFVAIPGVGRSVNGARRWVGVGPFTFQASELAKLFVIIYLSSYLTRRSEEVRMHISGFVKPMLVLALIAVLLLLEPDFGATVVLLTTALSLLFLAGVRLQQFILLFGLIALTFVGLVWSSPYRLQRLTGFLNPWANQFDSGYQLTQSLIAFGRGGWFGVGLGDSMQKLFYLPEAHTDFLFAVLAEELGLFGIIIVIALFTLLIARVFRIAHHAYITDRVFAAYLAFGLGMWLGLQAIVNVGVNSGMLPTKGLTLPMMSSGGSSLLVTCMVLAIIVRIDYEARLASQGFVIPT